MGDGDKTRQLDLDMETQLIEGHNFDDFRGREALTIPSEDDASKDTQLIHDDEIHSGSSSGRDGEVDSALSPLSSVLRRKTPHWAEFTHRDRAIDGVAGSASQMTFPYRDRYLGDTQILCDDENGRAHSVSAKGARSFTDTRAGLSGYPVLQSRESDVPHFLRDFDPNRRDYTGQRMVGSWHEVVGHINGCYDNDRGWESPVRSIRVVDSDASTADEDENHNNNVRGKDASYRAAAQLSQHAQGPQHTQLSQNVYLRPSIRVSSNFCSQDLNKSPEPEIGVDDWGEGDRVDLEVGGIDERGSNVGLFGGGQLGTVYPSQPVPGNKSVQGLTGPMNGTIPVALRTGGSIRSASLRQAGLHASSCSSSRKYVCSTPQGSKNDEVRLIEEVLTITIPNDVPHGSFCCNTPVCGPSMDRGNPSSSSSLHSALPDHSRDTESKWMADEGLGTGRAMDCLVQTKVEATEDTILVGADALEPEVCKPTEANQSRVRKLFLGDVHKVENEMCSSEGKDVEAQNWSCFENVDEPKKMEAGPLPPKEQHSSPVEKSLERRNSFGSGLFSGGSDMSYLSLQSPGEDSQARALNMVDKLVWLNAVGLPQELQVEEHKAPSRIPVNAKSALQSRMQVAEAKSDMDDPFGVFDWVDSQNDGAGMFFRGGAAKASTGKAGLKPSAALGHPKQFGFGSKKGSGQDVAGSCNRTFPERERVAKSLPGVDRQKGSASKNLAAMTESRREFKDSRSGKDVNCMGIIDNRQEPGCREAFNLGTSHQDTVVKLTDKRSGFLDKNLKKLGTPDSALVVEKPRHASTVKLQPQRIKHPVEQAKMEVSSNGNGFQHNRAFNKASNPLGNLLDAHRGRPDRTVEKGTVVPDRSPKHEGSPFGHEAESNCHGEFAYEAKPSIVTETRESNVRVILHEICTPAKVQMQECIQSAGDVEFPQLVTMDHLTEVAETMVETPPVTQHPLEKVECPTRPLEDVKAEPVSGMVLSEIYNPPIATPDFSLVSRGISGSGIGLSDLSQAIDLTVVQQEICESKAGLSQANLSQAIDLIVVQQDSFEIKAGIDLANLSPAVDLTVAHQDISESKAAIPVLSERAEKSPVSLEHTQEEMGMQLIVDFNGLPEGDDRLCSEMDRSSLVPVSISLFHQYEDGDVAELVPVQNVQISSDVEVSPEAMELQKNNLEIMIVDEAEGEDRDESLTPVRVPSENDMIDERKPNVGELFTMPDKGNNVTRKSRSQGRHNSKPSENTDVPGGSSNSTSRDRGRGKRVNWAGPLEQVLRNGVGIRRGRSLRQCNEGRAGVADDAADSSGQDEEGEDMKEATSRENGTRKRTAEALKMSGSGRDVLDKIKRRFDMSDNEVARLLGTEDEDAEVSLAASVKIRSLSHIKPEPEGNDIPPSPNFRRVGKGLRSARGRSEESSRRARACTSAEQGRLDVEELILPCSRDVLEDNIGTTGVQAHPSDNEALPGKRRMRSIADVSSPSHRRLTPGKPPILRGLRRRRGRHLVKSAVETKADPADTDLIDVPPSPLVVSPIVGPLRGKGGPRSARKRKEPESETLLPVSEVSFSPNSSKEVSPIAMKRRRWAGATRVLLSHGLNEDTIKQQRKIIAKLGGNLATSASDCSHFVADKFVRTGNMLEAMAAGKPVVTVGWLETSFEANDFVDEQEFILEDTKKEEEMGFSMVSTLAAAQRRPLLQGIRVYITPGTSPPPESLSRIVKAAGGQVVDEYFGPAPDGELESDFCIVISSEDEIDQCFSLLEQGAKVYTPEFLLSGVVTHHLDLSKDLENW